jgi:putative thiamine transport system ATP-binding protein
MVKMANVGLSNAEHANALYLDGVEIALNGKVLLKLDETIGAGEILTIMGPSGCGKSTLLAYIGGFLDEAFVAKGRVLLGDQDITQLQAELRRVGILFQDPLLFPHMSVGENLMFGLPNNIKGRDERREAVELTLDQANLNGFFDRDSATLSGGQKARVALMRVLLSNPKALLLDEPFSKLDTDLRGSIRDIVLSEAKRRNLPVVLVTHDEADGEAASKIAPTKIHKLV